MLCVDRAAVAGGGLATLEDPRHPGFLHNTHAFFQRAITAMPWYADLDLERHGARYIEPELNVALLTRDGRALEWWTDIERTIESVAQFSRRDADTLRRWHDEFVPIVQGILVPENRSPPLPPAERRALLERSAAGRRLLEVSALSPLEFVQREFEHPTVMAGLLFFNGLREVDLRVRGFGHHIAALIASPAKAQMSRGGSAALARALEAAMRASGGDIRLMTEPARIVVENGRAIGIETREGEMIRARHWWPRRSIRTRRSSNFSIRQWCQERFASRPSAFSTICWRRCSPSISICTSRRATRRAPITPSWRSAFMTIVGLDHVDQFFDIIRHHEAGTIPPTVMWGACPTLFDPSQAPAGKPHGVHVGEGALPARTAMRRIGMARARRTAATMLELWQQYAPNVRDAVIGSFIRSPLDIERSLPNMRDGDLLVGAFTNDQIGYNRPFPRRRHLPHAYPEALSVRVEQSSGRQHHRACPATTPRR